MKISKLVLRYDVRRDGKDNLEFSRGVVFEDVQQTVGVPNRFVVNNTHCIQGVFNSAEVYDDKGEELFHFEMCNLVTVHKYMKYFYITFFLGTETEAKKMVIFDDVSNQENVGMKAPWDTEDKIMIRAYTINEELECRRSSYVRDRPGLYSIIEKLKDKLSRIGDLNSVESNLLNTLQIDLYNNKESYISIENGMEFEFAKRDENDTSLEYILNVKGSLMCSTDDYIVAIYQRCEKTKQWQVKHVTILRNSYYEDKKPFNYKNFSLKIDLSRLIDYLVPIDNYAWADLDTFAKLRSSMDKEEYDKAVKECRIETYDENAKKLTFTDDSSKDDTEQKHGISAPWNPQQELFLGLYYMESENPTRYKDDIAKFYDLYKNHTEYFAYVDALTNIPKYSIDLLEQHVLNHIQYGFFNDNSIQFRPIHKEIDIDFDVFDDKEAGSDVFEENISNNIIPSTMFTRNTGEAGLKLKITYSSEIPLGKYIIVLYEKDTTTNQYKCIYLREYLNTDKFGDMAISEIIRFKLNLIAPVGALSVPHLFENWDGSGDINHYIHVEKYGTEPEKEEEKVNKKQITSETEYQIDKANQEDGNVNKDNSIKIGIEVKAPKSNISNECLDEDLKNIQEISDNIKKMKEALDASCKKQLEEIRKNEKPNYGRRVSTLTDDFDKSEPGTVIISDKGHRNNFPKGDLMKNKDIKPIIPAYKISPSILIQTTCNGIYNAIINKIRNI